MLSLLSWQVLARGVSSLQSGVVLGILDGANLIFHEAGHVLFAVFGEFLYVLGGSLVQVAIPAVCAVYFFLRRQPSASAVALFWTGESLTGVAIYIADAKRMELPLLGGDTGGSGHDWNYLLGRLNLINHAEGLGWFVFGLGVVTILAALSLLTADLVRAWKQSSVNA